MMPDVTAAKLLPFVLRSNGEPATDRDIERDFNKLSLQTVGKAAYKYEPFTRCVLPEAEIDALLEKRMAEFENGLRGIFPDYDIYPQPARQGLVDMAFKPGALPAGFWRPWATMRHGMMIISAAC